MGKKEISKFYPERAIEISGITDRVLSVIKEYNVSALDFIEIISNTKKEGLKQFKL